MASFDNGHFADMACLLHVGSSNKHFLCQSDWYVLSMHFLHQGAVEDDVGAGIWVSNGERVPLILIYLCWRSGRCYTKTVSALIVCVSDPSRHWALLLLVTALASSWWMAVRCTDPQKTHVYAVSPPLWISIGLQRLFITHILRFLNAQLWDMPVFLAGIVPRAVLFFCLFGLLVELCKSFPYVREHHHLARQEVWFLSFKYSGFNLCVLAGLLGCGVKVRCVTPGASASMQSTVGFSRVLKESMEWQS